MFCEILIEGYINLTFRNGGKNMNIKQLSLLLLLLANTVNAKTLIITFSYSNPEFIPIQQKTFKHFMKDDYDFVVFSDAPTESGHKEIYDMCVQCDVACIRIPQHIHEYPYYLPLNMPQIYSNHTVPSNVRHVHCVQYSLNALGFDRDDVVMLIDSDMFLIRPLSVTDYMKDCDIASFFKGSSNEQGQSIMYCCPALTLLNMKTLPDKRSLNFNCGWVNGCSGDSGGFTHYYLKDHPELRIKNITTLYSGHLFCTDRFFPQNNQHNANRPADQKISSWKAQGFNDKEINFLLKNPDTIQYFMEGNDCWFFHYRGGTNYERLPAEYHVYKKNLINQYVQDIMS